MIQKKSGKLWAQIVVCYALRLTVSTLFLPSTYLSSSSNDGGFTASSGSSGNLFQSLISLAFLQFKPTVLSCKDSSSLQQPSAYLVPFKVFPPTFHFLN